MAEEGQLPASRSPSGLAADTLLSKYGPKKVRLDVPEEPEGLGDGFRIRFRLSRAYRALEKQEHTASKPNIEPYRKNRRKSELSQDPLENTLDEFEDNAHAFLWSDPKSLKEKTPQRPSIWELLAMKMSEQNKEDDSKDEKNSQSKKKGQKEGDKGINVDEYIKILGKSMPLAKRDYERNKANASSNYFMGVRNLVAGQKKAMEPFKSTMKKETKKRPEKDPEKTERLRLAREKLKAKSKYSSFWAKLKDNKNNLVAEEQKEKPKKMMAWCAADNSFTVMEWEQKRRKKEQQKKEKAQKAINANKRYVRVASAISNRTTEKAPPGSADDLAIVEEVIPEQDHPVDEEKTDELLKEILMQKGGRTSPMSAGRTRSKSVSEHSKKLDEQSRRSRSSLSKQEEEQSVEEEEESREESYKSYTGFASLLGSSSTSSEGSSKTTSTSRNSADSALKILTRPKSILKSRRDEQRKQLLGKPQFQEKPGTPEIEIVTTGNDAREGESSQDAAKRKHGSRPGSAATGSESRPSSGKSERSKSSGQRKCTKKVNVNKPLKTCKYLYRMCNCQNISQRTTMSRLGSRGRTVGTITVYGCPSASMSGSTQGDQVLVCPFCKVFPGQKIQAWMKWNEISQQFDDDVE